MFIAFHIKHGFQSALKTFGILRQSRMGILYNLSFVFWGINSSNVCSNSTFNSTRHNKLKYG